MCTGAGTAATQAAAHRHTFQRGNGQTVAVSGGKKEEGSKTSASGEMVGFVASLIIMECLAVFLFGSEMYLLSSKLRFILDQNTDYTETAS